MIGTGKKTGSGQLVVENVKIKGCSTSEWCCGKLIDRSFSVSSQLVARSQRLHVRVLGGFSNTSSYCRVCGIMVS